MTTKQKPIAVFDSGVGGISVLGELKKLIPNENYIYFGDSKNAPYGTKGENEIKHYTDDCVKRLIDMGVKAVVIACNTATSVAADMLRQSYTIPIIGIEPAVKPAAIEHKGENILVMATPVTLKKEKFQRLIKNYSDMSEIIPLPCPGLADIIEKGIISGDEINLYLKNILAGIDTDNISAVVLGCTHYPFIKNEIKKWFPTDTDIIDGGAGTAKETKRRLSELDMLNTDSKNGEISFISSMEKEEEIKLMKNLFNSIIEQNKAE